MTETVYSLAAFGNVSTLAGAQKAFDKAIAAARQNGGGIIEIPPDTSSQFLVSESIDHATIVDARAGVVVVQSARNTKVLSGSGGYPAGGVLVRRTHGDVTPQNAGNDYVVGVLQRNIRVEVGAAYRPGRGQAQRLLEQRCVTHGGSSAPGPSWSSLAPCSPRSMTRRASAVA